MIGLFPKMVFVRQSFNSGSFNVAHSIAPRLTQPQVSNYWKYIWWNFHSNLKCISKDLKFPSWIILMMTNQSYFPQSFILDLSLLWILTLIYFLAFSHRGGNRKLSFFQLLIFKMSASLKMSIILSGAVEKFVELPFENIWYFWWKARPQ